VYVIYFVYILLIVPDLPDATVTVTHVKVFV